MPVERRAVKNGVIIKTNDKITSVRDLDGDFIIDASGCWSVIRREQLGFKRGIKGLTYKQTLGDSNCFKSDTLKIIFIGSFGYYWIFPRYPLKREVNVGLGLFRGANTNLKKSLKNLKYNKILKVKLTM